MLQTLPDSPHPRSALLPASLSRTSSSSFPLSTVDHRLPFSNSHRMIFLADPHPLTPMKSYSCKKQGGGGTPSLCIPRWATPRWSSRAKRGTCFFLPSGLRPLTLKLSTLNSFSTPSTTISKQMTYKSFRITSFAHPLHVNPIESHLSKKGGEGGGGHTRTHDFRVSYFEFRVSFVARTTRITRQNSMPRSRKESPDPNHPKMLRYPQGATRFRRKLSRPEGMPGPTCPQRGGN